jgi:ADP-ribose pyrophosphatase YjhB (NUDIX family)
MTESNRERDLPRRHPNDTLQIVVKVSGRILLVHQPNRRGGPCWELPGGSYQLNKGLSPEAAAVATLEHQVGLRLPEKRARLIYMDYPWNGLDPTRNECAEATVYVVVIDDVLADEYFPKSAGALRSDLFSKDEVGATWLRLDFFAYAALRICDDKAL